MVTFLTQCFNNLNISLVGIFGEVLIPEKCGVARQARNIFQCILSSSASKRALLDGKKKTLQYVF